MQDRTDALLLKYNAMVKRNEDVYRRAARQSGLSESAHWILYTLLINPRPVSQREICDMTYQPKQSINSALKKLEQDGHIRLAFGENNRKTKLIHLTPGGRMLAEATAGRVIQAEKNALSKLGEVECAKLYALFETYTQLLNEEIHQINARDGEDRP